MSLQDDIDEVRHNTKLEKKSKHMKKATDLWIDQITALEIFFIHDEKASEDDDDSDTDNGVSPELPEKPVVCEKKYYRGLSLYRFCKKWSGRIQPAPAREKLINPLIELGFLKELEKSDDDKAHRYHITQEGRIFYLYTGKKYVDGYKGIYEGLLITPLARRMVD